MTDILTVKRVSAIFAETAMEKSEKLLGTADPMAMNGDDVTRRAANNNKSKAEILVTMFHDNRNEAVYGHVPLMPTLMEVKLSELKLVSTQNIFQKTKNRILTLAPKNMFAANAPMLEKEETLVLPFEPEAKVNPLNGRTILTLKSKRLEIGQTG